MARWKRASGSLESCGWKVENNRENTFPYGVAGRHVAGPIELMRRNLGKLSRLGWLAWQMVSESIRDPRSNSGERGNDDESECV